jgi:hypothetical protein
MKPLDNFHSPTGALGMTGWRSARNLDIENNGDG